MNEKTKVIDVHSHIIPSDFSILPATTQGWPSLKLRDDGRADMMINGQLYRVIERGYFDLATRLELMERDGVDVQVVSPLPEMLGYWLQAQTATVLAELVNRVIADAVASAAGRIEGLGMLPLQDLATSIAMIPGLVDQGLRGIEVGSNVNGRSIADPYFDPLYAALQANNLCVFVHGLRPPAEDRLLGPKMMVNVIGIPSDCAAAIGSFISMDILGKFPDLRLGFAHAGGSFGSVLSRMDFVWHQFERFRGEARVAPKNYIKKFFFDTITYSAQDLRHLLSQFGEESFFCGSDGPAIGSQLGLRSFVAQACGENTEQLNKLLWRNAERFLGID